MHGDRLNGDRHELSPAVVSEEDTAPTQFDRRTRLAMTDSRMRSGVTEESITHAARNQAAAVRRGGGGGARRYKRSAKVDARARGDTQAPNSV